MIRLTDEEIDAIYQAGWWGAGVDYDEAIATAQLKKVIDWLDTECAEHPKVTDYGERYLNHHVDCPECWQVLLKESST